MAVALRDMGALAENRTPSLLLQAIVMLLRASAQKAESSIVANISPCSDADHCDLAEVVLLWRPSIKSSMISVRRRK